MVACCVRGCSNRSEIHCKGGIRFFTIPKIRENVPLHSKRRYEKRRAMWLSRIRKLGLLYEEECLRICSLHFVSGKPASFGDELSPDWSPSINLGCPAVDNSPDQRGDAKVSAEPESDTPVGSALVQPGDSHDEENQELVETGKNQDGHGGECNSSVRSQRISAVDMHLSCDSGESVDDDDDMLQSGFDEGAAEKEYYNSTFGVGHDVVNSTVKGLKESSDYSALQKEFDDLLKSKSKLRNDLTEAEVDKLELSEALSLSFDKCEVYASKCDTLESENAALRAKLKQFEAQSKVLEERAVSAESKVNELENRLVQESKGVVTLEKLEKDDFLVKYYTGLPSYGVFNAVLTLVTSQVTDTCHTLIPGKCLLLTLMRLRLGLQSSDLAYRFDISKASACRIFEKWLYYLYVYLEPSVNWPDRETLHKTMPNSFKAEFGKSVAVIIDCFELFCNRPGAQDSRAMTWSNYKHHNTVKFLIGITPLGEVSFISQGWGGRVSDKHITTNSGLYEKLLPNDVILADRGFTISDDVSIYCARLLIPALTRRQVQLSAHDVTDTRRYASLRVHVERVIGLVKNRYRILKTTLHHSFLDVKPGHNVAQIDELVRVCCALTNLSPGII